MQTQIEIDFVKHLRELARDAPLSDPWRLENANRDDDGSGDEFCEDCILVVATEAKAAGSDICEPEQMSAMECDSSAYCAKCGCNLACSLTDSGIEEDVDWLVTSGMNAISGNDAASLLTWFPEEMNREKHWPMIKPVAVRILECAVKTIVPDGFVRFSLADAITGEWPSYDSIWMSIYGDVANAVVAWADGQSRCEVLKDTSGINCSQFDEWESTDGAFDSVRRLVLEVGRDSERGRFLREHFGFKTLGDLYEPIVIRDQRFDRGSWDVRGRIFAKQPNKVHPGAMTATRATIRLQNDGRWVFRIYYEYGHWMRHSSWCVSVVQKTNESLPCFVSRVDQFIESTLLPITEDRARILKRRCEDWDAIYAALKSVYRFASDEDLEEMTTAIVYADCRGQTRRINMTPERMEAIKTWKQEDSGEE